jgi:hypothetical protein
VRGLSPEAGGTAKNKEANMSAQVPNTFVFRWRSLFGVAVALFLLYGAFNVLSAVFVPVSLHLGGAGAAPGGTLVLSETADADLLGRSLADVDEADPALGAFFVSFMDTMCAYMMAFALVQIGVAWFALRRGRRWALWTLATADLSLLPYYVAIIETYGDFGVSPGNISAIVISVVVTVAATALGWLGLRREPRGTAASV